MEKNWRSLHLVQMKITGLSFATGCTQSVLYERNLKKYAHVKTGKKYMQNLPAGLINKS
jgi:hypothetical protein